MDLEHTNILETTYNSWPAEGRPRPKVPNLGAVYTLPEFLRIADKINAPYCGSKDA